MSFPVIFLARLRLDKYIYREISVLKHFLLAAALLQTCAFSYAGTPQSHPIKHVIYITLDGTRWQDILQQRDYFPKLWRQHAAKMSIYGMPGTRLRMEVASIPVSLPSYQSQMTGVVQPCENNECGQVKMETMPEFLLSTLHLQKKDVAVFSSWPVIADALESKRGTVYSNVGNLPVNDPVTGQPDADMASINHLQTLRHHEKTNRLDEYTFAQALHYFQKYQPVFLWISLVNADNEAHDNHLDQYHQVLLSYDHYLDELFTTLKKSGLEKNTMIVITTDHGRGDGGNWTTHGKNYPEAKATWAFVYNGKLQPVRDDGKYTYYDTTSIRSAIQAALVHHS